MITRGHADRARESQRQNHIDSWLVQISAPLSSSLIPRFLISYTFSSIDYAEVFIRNKR